jgi:hypothetical protein
MSAIRVKTIIDSETLYLPELRAFIGHEVEIIVVDQEPRDVTKADEFWKARTLDELAVAQGVFGASSIEQLYGDWNDADFDGFDEAVQVWRDSGSTLQGR